MRNSIASDGFPGDMANWIFSAFKSVQDDSSIYLGFKRIDQFKVITHDIFMDLILPGNAAIIFKVNDFVHDYLALNSPPPPYPSTHPHSLP
jgi:hypothetical protein